MATTRELIDDLEKRKADLAALAVSPESAVPLSAPPVEDPTPPTLAGSLPFTPGTAAPSSAS